RPDQRTHATDDHHGQDIEWLGYGKRIRHQGANKTCVETSGGAGDGRTDTKGEYFPGGAVNAKRGRRNLVLADCRECFANRRADKLAQQEVRKKGETRNKVKERGEIPKIRDDRPTNNERRRRCDTVNTERPLGQADPVQQNLMNDDGKSKRGNRKIVAAQTHREEREKNPGDPANATTA